MKCVLQFVNEAIKLLLARIKEEELKIRRCVVVFESLVNKTGAKMFPFLTFWGFILFRRNM